MSTSTTTGARLAPVAVGCALVGAAITVAVIDPSSPDSVYPPCLFHAATGLWCPGCGLTRGTHHLLNGNVVDSLSSNLFTPLVLAGIALAWLTWLAGTFGRSARPVGQWLPARASTALLIVVVAYGVLRNLPFAPLDALAP